MIRHLGKIAGILLLAGCSTLGITDDAADKKSADKNKRVAVMNEAKQLKADAGVAGRDWIKLPPPVINPAWPQSNANALNAPGHPALGRALQRVWRSSIGDGSSGSLRLLARPLVAKDRVYAMDASGHVAAFSSTSGDKLWRVSTQAEDSEADEAIGGGIAIDGDKIFATTGHGEVVALSADDGKFLWRRKLNSPLRAAPTVAEGRVYVVTVGNTTTALNAADGAVLWTHSGLSQTAALMGAASPAVIGDTVVVAYSSGEIFALRAQNGKVAWGDVLVTPLAVGALPEMADIRGAPVADRGGVFALSHSGRMVALVTRSGERGWEVDLGGSNTPAVAGNVLYVLTSEQQLVAVRRDNGKIIWAQDLPRRTDPEDKESDIITWTGPVLAGGRLFLVNSNDQLAEYDALDGKEGAVQQLPDASFIAPVVAQNRLFVVTENGALLAFQ